MHLGRAARPHPHQPSHTPHAEIRCKARRRLFLIHADSCAPQLGVALCERFLALALDIIGAAAIVRAHLGAADAEDGL